jgi:hypothetical protein
MSKKQLRVMPPDVKSQLPIYINQVEERYNAKYVGDFCIKTTSGWTDAPAAIFYTEHPDEAKGHTHYFAIYLNPSNPLSDFIITKGDSAFSQPIIGLVTEDGTVIFSRYGHDFRSTPDGSFIDGGRDYCRTGGDINNHVLVRLIIDKDKLVIDEKSIDTDLYSI